MYDQAMLQVLGYCISQLSTQKKTDKGVHIPYRSLGYLDLGMIEKIKQSNMFDILHQGQQTDETFSRQPGG